MSGIASQDLASPEHHQGLMALQRQTEHLFLAKKALEAEVIQLRDAPVRLFSRPAPPNLLLRMLGRLMPRVARYTALRVLRQSGLLDAAWYHARYPDLAKAKADPTLHYLLWGAAEERDPGPYFCTADYVQLYPDVAEARINPLLHYIQTGWQEGRKAFPAPAKPKAAKPTVAKRAQGQ